MANYKYNGKMLNGISSYDMSDRDRKQRLMSPTDNSGNKVVAGMEVLYLPGVKYANISIPSYISSRKPGVTVNICKEGFFWDS